jgi:hypothetical protein
MTKSTMTSKYTSVAAHFEGLVDASEQYRQHCPVWHVQGYPGSYWTPPLGYYSLRIAPVATRATANKTVMRKWTNFAGHFDGRGGAQVQYRAYPPMEEVQGFTRSHWMLQLGKYCG